VAILKKEKEKKTRQDLERKKVSNELILYLFIEKSDCFQQLSPSADKR
jgi:hypothetical protein